MSDENEILGDDQVDALGDEIGELPEIGDIGEIGEIGEIGNVDGEATVAAPAAERPQSSASARNRAVFGVPVELVVSVGRARPLVGELLDMTGETLIPLDARIDDPVELIVGDRVLARGELHEMEDGSGRLAVRLTEIVEVAEQP